MAGAAQVFALCHQQRQRDSSVLKMEVCRARSVVGEKAGALSHGGDGRESPGSTDAGQRAQPLSEEEGEPREPAVP